MQPGFDLDEVDLGLPGTGSLYQPLDRTSARKKKGDFWLGVATMGPGCGLMVDWEWAFGSTVDAILPFLKLTGEQAETFPCPAISHCGCRHTIGERPKGGLVATCACGGARECETCLLEPGDILYHGLQWRAFGEALRRALGLAEVLGPGYSSPAARLVEIGSYASVAVPVYLSLVEEAALVREVRQLLAFREGPFLLLTPTGRSWSPEVEAMARPYTGGHISLSSVLDVNGKGFVSKGTIEPMLVEYAKRVVLLRENAGAAVQTVRSIHREIAAVRDAFVELRTAKQRLEKMLADGLFAFTQKVDATSFKVLCTILAEGDVAKASRRLRESEDTTRATVRRWVGKGRAYAAMLELVRWRKRVGSGEKVPLNDAIVHERAAAADYPGLLSDVLDGLLSMTEENWAERSEELAELLRPFMAGS